MTPIKLLQCAIVPALAELAKLGIPDSREARRFALAIALQETGLAHRRQVGASGLEDGPAASFWQFEQGGGCKGVLTHPVAAPIMRQVCSDYRVEVTEAALWAAMRYNDIVAACAARLLFYVLPDALPTTLAHGWDQYSRAWRPGKPRPDAWAANWQLADLTVRSNP